MLHTSYLLLLKRRAVEPEPEPPQGGSGGWVTFMYPSNLTCAPSEAVTDFGVNPTSDEWAKAWDAHMDVYGY